MQPIGNNVLVKCFPGSEVSEGNIFVPDSVRKESNKVQIIAVGPGTAKRKMYLKKGDIGYRVKDWGEPIIIDEETHYLMDDSAILALE